MEFDFSLGSVAKSYVIVSATKEIPRRNTTLVLSLPLTSLHTNTHTQRKHANTITIKRFDPWIGRLHELRMDPPTYI